MSSELCWGRLSRIFAGVLREALLRQRLRGKSLQDEGGLDLISETAHSMHTGAEEAVMEPLSFRFADLHTDAPDLPDDLDWLLRFVAGKFEVRVRNELLYEEVEFPVLELAHVLDAWMKCGLAGGHDLDYDVTGGERGTLLFGFAAGGWLLDSADRSPNTPVPAPLTDDDLRSATCSFIEELDAEAGRDHGVHVRALRERVRSRASR